MEHLDAILLVIGVLIGYIGFTYLNTGLIPPIDNIVLVVTLLMVTNIYIEVRKLKQERNK